MAREQFLYEGTEHLCALLDEAGRRAGVSRGQAFEDFLTCTVCALSNRQMEQEYLAVVAKGYGAGGQGRRGIDALTQAFATLIQLMEDTRRDILGDLFQGGITYGEAGQFLTPEPLCRLMAELCVDGESDGRIVCDPCSGSGRMLLAYADVASPRELVGQDVDLRCVKMTGINLALRNLYGVALWGNSLAHEVKLGYRTGFNLAGGFIRPLEPEELRRHVPPHDHPDVAAPPMRELPPGCVAGGPPRQLPLF